MYQINYFGPIYNCSGYSQLKYLLLELSRRGHNVRIKSFGNRDPVNFLHHDEFKELEETELQDPYINIVSGIGPQIRRDDHAAYNIAYSMFETITIPENWIKFYNELDEVWTPSEFCRKAFSVKELKCSVKTIPFGIDTNLFHYKKNKGNLFTFLSIGKWIDRKGWDLLINAYTSEFIGDYDVRLCIKTDEPYKTKEELVKEYLTTDRTSHMPRIMVNNQKSDESTIPLFYQEADCFILPSRGEAYCLPALEAMASGIPVIISDFGGQLDFINENIGWFIPINKLMHLSDRLCKINTAYKNLWFAEPEIKDIRTLMRTVYEDRDEVRKKGIKAREFVEQNYTWPKVADLVEDRLKEIWRNL